MKQFPSRKRRFLAWMLLAIALLLTACAKVDTPVQTSAPVSASTQTPNVTKAPQQTPVAVESPTGLDPQGIYTSKDDVALYLHQYGELPTNFITKSQARALGWPGGDLRPYAPDKCIGGDRFGNYEGLLPKKSGRVYYECDIDTLGASSRGPKRIVYSNDGLIFYTSNHYESFEQLYGGKK